MSIVRLGDARSYEAEAPRRVLKVYLHGLC
jgi:hypothetical protein